jgi:hypothetical protein
MFGFLGDDTNDRSSGKRRTAKLIVILAIVAVVFGLLPIIQPGIFVGTAAVPIVAVMSFLSAFLIAGIARSAQTEAAIGKRKRGLEGQDMYSLIDRVVDDLDEDELDYLHRRLEARENTEPDVTDSLSELLDQREGDRRSGQP